jgi:ABC-type branched-subunit amino acid transport system ATPase component/ABC-type branched-subunit amino acid transport system permease subunit
MSRAATIGGDRLNALSTLAVGLGLAILLLTPLAGLSEYKLSIARLALFSAAMAATWSLLAGIAGQFSFAHVAIAGISGYAAAIWSRDINLLVPTLANPWFGLAAGIAAAAVVGTTLGMVVLRLRGTYMALFTLAFGEIARLVVIAEKDFTGGRLSLATTRFPGDGTTHYYLLAAALLLVLLAIYAIVRSRLGLFLRAMREDADAAAAMGIDIVRLKVLIFSLTSVLVGFIAAVYFQTIPRLTPDMLNLLEMGFVVVYTVFGGLESPIAGVIAAIILVIALEALRAFQIGSVRIEIGVWRYAVFGALLIITLRLAPNGFIAPLLTRLLRVQQVSLAGTGARRPSPSARAAGTPSLVDRAGPRRIDLQIENLEMRFGGMTVFSGVSLALAKPEVCGLIGPNGAGKTTLVNVVTGYYAPTGGAIISAGERIDGLPPHGMVLRGIGRTFQIARSFRRMSALENLLVPQLALRPTTPHAQAIERAEEVLTEVGLTHLKNALAQSLSGGQQKLLELARLLMLDPAILILDEPFAGVNPALKESICDLVRRLRDQGHAILLIEHDLTTVFALCDRLVVLADGRVIDDGPPHIVRANPEVIAAYLGQTHGEPAAQVASRAEAGASA